MAQKKRRTKHRGNAAGMIVARGDTGRGRSAADPRVDAKAAARQKRMERFDKPPSWRGALNRALIATGIFAVVIVAFFGQPATAAIPLAFFMLVLYVPMGYYTDRFFYNRRQRQKTKAGR